MPLTVLSHAQLRSLLLSLTQDEIISIQKDLAVALREYSLGNQTHGCSASYQPRRTVITRLNGCSTLFMPASTGRTLGIKMISLQDGDVAGSAVEGGLDAAPNSTESAARNGNGNSTGNGDVSPKAPRSSGPRASSASLSSEQSEGGSLASQDESSSSPSVSANNNNASGSINELGLSETMGGWPAPGTRDTSPKGSVTLVDEEGLPFGLINALELTAFRTALSTTMLFNKRKRARTLVVFGAGRQAYWHIRLALTLRGADIKRVYIFNRSFDRVMDLLKDIYSPANSSWRGDVKFSAVSSDFVEYGRLLTEAIRKADAIFCCTPSIEPLFPADLLTSKEGRRKGRFVCAVGSYKPHMTELHPDILRDEVNLQGHPHKHFQKQTRPCGVVVVDSLGAAMKEAGEIIQAEIQPHQVVELGELLMVRQATRRESITSSENALQDDNREKEEKSLRKWIEGGNVMFKSVGLGLMDVVSGGHLIDLARERGVGTLVEDF